ncbi:hypothetical protein Ssi03_05500 [Sphaerisporangium siamense]|uniref:Acetyl esterase/lipase n=1 Tax=Sphaerisporangium siamense TaxID=795645 RepID=A0A7W7DC29_9ACTN|nr:alpha/beta hydrolase [Sphaerisporangium siamense]MBB4704084.1 acetyl esterase/lipase [Sphaerisporangium siamense]GII82560.1 hypothetical protein Ssi03_05500 [Sphaerisporangium siamense]
MGVSVVAGPGLVADPRLLEEVAGAELAALGVPGRFTAVSGVAELRAALGAAGEGQALVVMPGPLPEARRLIGLVEDHSPRTVWLDLDRVGPIAAAGGAAHHQGRGVAGLIWAIRHAVHRLRWPPHRIPYGPHADQWAELRLPGDGPERYFVKAASWDNSTLKDANPAHEDTDAGERYASGARGGSRRPPEGRAPVAVLVHGGFWRTIWGADLMDALAIDLARRGFASWNLEYRRPDLHGWQATTADVAVGVAALASVDAPLDLDRVALIGHSAGGQLALRAAADMAADTRGAAPGAVAGSAVGPASGRVRVALAVSLAGILDLVEGERRRLSSGGVSDALGGPPERIPEVYAAAGPMERLPLGVPQLVVQGATDDLDLVDISRRYAREAGEEASYLERPGDHWAVIDPHSPIWLLTARELAARLSPR